MSPAPIPTTVLLADGVELDADLWLPAAASAASPAPGVVMSHGFSATRHMALPSFAEAFATAGAAVLLYDHRGLGRSGGGPRQTIDPWQQSSDMVEVLGWLAERPEVDAERLGVWGSSFSGGEAIVVGAVDERVRAVVANTPFAGLGDLAADDVDTAEARFEAIAAVLRGQRPRPEPRPIGPMAVVPEGDDEAAMLPQEESCEWFLANGPGTGWENRCTLVMSDDPPFDPAACAPHVAPAALLMVVAEHDRVAPAEVALSTFERASEPKQLEVVPGHHFVDYQGEHMGHAIEVMTRFLLAHL
jgi:hypothetical protein